MAEGEHQVIQHLILRPGAQPEVQQAEALTYSHIVDVVGYPVELININGGSAVMYVCEEAKQNNEDRNEAATRIARTSLRDGDFISGTVLIVGPLGPGGVDTSLPDDTRDELLASVSSG
jgi:hypothetical protein